MGDAILILLGMLAGGYLLVAPAIAVVVAYGAARRRDQLERRVAWLEHTLVELQQAAEANRRGWLRQQPQGDPRPAGWAPAPGALAPAPPSPVAVPAPPPVAVPAELAPEASLAAGGLQGEAAPVALTPLPEPAPGPGPASLEATAPQPPGTSEPPEPRLPVPESQQPLPAPPPPQPPPVPAPPPPRGSRGPRGPKPGPSLEEHIALAWLTRIGAGVFLVGALFFFKYAVDNAWIGPAGRVAVGAVVGTALLVVAEVIRQKTRPRFVHALTGIGVATLVVSVWASAAFYQLVTASAAFVATSVILLVAAALAYRYRGEAILALALLGGFLNPVVLSTGEDRPLALFGYLFLLTGVAHAVALARRFRFVPWIGITGVVLLFAGWYGRFFDLRDQRGAPYADLPPEKLVGAYHELSARLVPLGAVLAFAAAWAAVALGFQRADRAASPPGAKTPYATAIGLAALVLAHAGLALLLPDAPRALPLLATALAVGSIALLRRLGATRLLVLPMGAAFAAFLAVSFQVQEADRVMLVGFLGVWTLVYLAGFLRAVDRAHAPGGAPLPPASAIGSSIAVGLFACLAAILLIDAHPAMFAVLLAGASVIVGFVASRSGWRGLLLVAALLGAAVLGVASPFVLERALVKVPGAHTDPAFLAGLALWALTYLGSIAEDFLRRRAEVTPVTLLTASAATLGFLAAALVATGSDVPTLRALLTAGAGVAALGLGALLVLARPAERTRARALAGQALVGEALGLFAAAIAFGLSGATITLLWAALAAVAVSVAARAATGERQPGDEAVSRLWLAIGAALFLATLTRVLGVDVPATAAIGERYLSTHGREGALAAPVLWNPRAYAFAGTAVALLLSARLLARARPFQAPAALAGIGGYGLLLALLVTEVRAALTHLPPAPPYPLDDAEWGAFLQQYQATLDPQRGPLDMMTTLLLAAFAAALLVAGFAARDAFHRYLGLSLFVITVAKLALYDVWRVERIYQIGLLTGVGALLVGGGFLYARFGQRLVALVRDGRVDAPDDGPEGDEPGGEGPPPGEGGAPAPGGAGSPPHGAGLLVFLLLTAAAARASAQQVAPRPAPLRVTPFETARPLEGVDAPGDYRFEVDLDLYRESLAQAPLDDLRIAGPDGLEVPFVVRDTGPPPVDRWFAATMVDPSVGGTGPVSATWVLDAPGRHCRIELSLDGETFLRRVRIETGEKAKSLTTVAEGGYVYRIRQGGIAVESADVRYPLSQASMVRVTLVPDGPPSRVRIDGGRISCTPPEASEPVQTVPLAIEGVTRDEAAKTTTTTLDAGGEGLPLRALLLDVRTPEFSRGAELTATNYRALWAPAGGGFIYRIQPRPGVDLSRTRVPVSLPRKRWLRLTVADGDSAPLDLQAVSGEVRTREVIFRAAAAGEHRLYVGDRSGTAPRYDLSDILERAARAAPPRPATLGAATKNPKLGVEEVPASLPFTEQHRTLLGAALAAALLALSLWAVLLLRKSDPAGPRPG